MPAKGSSMTFKEMLDYIKNVIQDSAAFTDTAIKAQINARIQNIARGIKRPQDFQLSPPLSDLYTSAEVTTATGTNAVALPDDFCRMVDRVLVGGALLTRFDSFQAFKKRHPIQEVGSLTAFCVFGSKIYYADIPSIATDMTVFYYRKPDDLVNDNDVPVCIPEPLHQDLICSGVCSNLFDRIEDGIEGRKVNTIHHANLAIMALESMGLYVDRNETGFNLDNDGDYIYE